MASETSSGQHLQLSQDQLSHVANLVTANLSNLLSPQALHAAGECLIFFISVIPGSVSSPWLLRACTSGGPRATAAPPCHS